MADYNLGTARGVIEIDYKGQGAASQAEKDLAGVGKTSSKTSQTVQATGRNMGRAGLLIAGGLAAAVAASANFEQRLSAVAAVSGASSDEMEKLRNKSLQLGKDTVFSASEAAQAIEELVKAGVSVPDVMNGAADATVALAAAGEISLPEAATIASNAMNQFGLAAEDLPNVADKIAGAANASAIDVSDLGMSLSQAGAVAHLAGATFDDTATAIALMGNAGIKGSDAGTSLKSMFQRLQPTTQKQIDLMHELGIVTADGSNRFYDARGNMKSLGSVAQVLQNSLKGMTKQQKQATLQTLFGSDAIRGAAILAENGAKGFNKMSDSMKKVSAADVAAKRMDNLKGKLEQMKGSLETAAIVMGDTLIPAVTALIEWITGLFNAFLNLPAGVQKAIVIFAAVVAAALLIASAIIKIVFFAKRLQIALGILRTAMASTWLAALGPIGLIIAAVIAIVAIIVLLWKKNETFRKIVLAVWAAIKAAVEAVVNWFKGPFLSAFETVWSGLKTGVAAVWGFFKTVWNGIKTVVMTYVSIIVTIVKTYFTIYKTIITTVLRGIMATWNAIWGTFGPVIKAVFGLIVAIVKLEIAIVLLVIRTVLFAIKAVWSAVWGAIKAVVAPVWNAIRSVVSSGVKFVRSAITKALNAVESVWSAVWGAVKAVAKTAWAGIKATVSAGVNFVKSILTSVFNALKGIASRAWQAVDNVVGDKIRAIMDKVKGIKDDVIGFFSGAFEWLKDAGSKIVGGLIAGITSRIKDVTSAITGITNKLSNFVPGSPVKEGPLKVLNRGHAGKEIVQFLVTGMQEGEREARVASQDVAATIQGALSSFRAPDYGALLAAANQGGLSAPLAVGAPPRVAFARERSGSSDEDRRLRLVEGRLSLDSSGRAFITGVAEEVVDRSNSTRERYERMA